MKNHTEYLIFNTAKRQEFLNITGEVESAIRKGGIKEGLCLVNAMHITSSVFTDDQNSMQKGGEVQVQDKAGISVKISPKEKNNC